CFTSSIGQSTCNALDFTCMCGDEAFLAVAQTCILEECSTLDALDVTRSVSQGCGLERRNRKTILLFPLIAEIPAAFCPWLRLFTNWRLAGKVALDDYLMTAAGSASLHSARTSGTSIQTRSSSASRYVPFIRHYTTHAHYRQLFYIDEPFYLVTLALTKVSVLCFYLRIFPTRTFRYTAYAAMAFIIIPTTICLFLQIFQCRPVHLIWDGWLSKEWEDNCLNINVLAYVAGSFSIAQDLMLIVLPMPWLVRLNIGLKTKLGVMLMFSLGVFVLATSCTRLVYILAFGHTQNPTWDYVDPLIWSGLEVAVSVIITCLPALRVLILHFIPSFRSTSHPSS
ncbi:hypothetical protein CC79DRAFT_1256850, partial [Sarocladium strictum]